MFLRQTGGALGGQHIQGLCGSSTHIGSLYSGIGSAVGNSGNCAALLCLVGSSLLLGSLLDVVRSKDLVLVQNGSGGFRCQRGNGAAVHSNTPVSGSCKDGVDGANSLTGKDCDLNGGSFGINASHTGSLADAASLVVAFALDKAFSVDNSHNGNAVSIAQAHKTGCLSGALVAQGTLCHKCTAKAARFVRLCDAYSIPVVTVVNTEGFVKSEGDDQAGGIRQAARMAGVYAEATTVKVAILAGEAVGPIYTVFAASADWRIAVDGCTVAPLAPETAATVLYKDEIFASDNIQQATKQKAAAYKAEQCSAVAAVANGAADAAVKAADVRAAAAQALDMLATKRTTRLPKKHGNITL